MLTAPSEAVSDGGYAGDTELMASVDEARKCSRHLKLESVQQDPPLLQFWLDRYRTICSRLIDATLKGAPQRPAAPHQQPFCMHGHVQQGHGGVQHSGLSPS